MKKMILLSAIFAFSLACEISKGADVEAYPENNPPPAAQPTPRPDLMPQGPVEAEPEHGYRREGTQGPSHQDVRTESWDYEARTRFNLGIYYNFSGGFYSSNSTVDTPGATFIGPISADVDNAAGLNAEIFQAPPMGWGFDAGLNYDFTRNINDLNDAAASVYYTSSKPTIQFTTLYGNAIFRFRTVYVPFGLNYTFPNFSGGSNNGAITNSTFTGNLGFQFGIGFLLNDRFTLELEDRILHFKGTSASSTVTIDWGDIYTSGLQLNLKFSLL